MKKLANEHEQQPWEAIEPYLGQHEQNGSDFSAVEHATSEGIESWEASARIQDYLREQRKIKSEAKYVIHRVPGTRTRAARWAVGARSQDATGVGQALTDDVRTRVQRAFAPDLRAIAEHNPRAAKKAGRQITAVTDHAIAILAAAAEGLNSDEE